LPGRSSALAAAVLLAGGCSATRFDHDPCTAHSQCRASFGFGAVCGPQGFCGPATLARCDRSYPDDLLADGPRYRKAVVLGSLTDRSNPAELIRERAVRLAVKEANEAGGLDGHPLGVVLCDIQASAGGDRATRPVAAVQTARRLVGELGLPALLGPADAADVQEVWQEVRGAGTLVLSPSASSPGLAALEPEASDAQPGLLWSVAPPDLLQARVIADDLLARQVERVHLIRETGVYGEALAALITERFRQGGGTLHLESVPAQARIGEAARAVAGDEAEVLFISSQPGWIVDFLKQAAGEVDYAHRSIFLTDAAASPDVLQAASDAAALFSRIRGTRPAPADPQEHTHASFVARYRAEYGGQDPGGAPYSSHAHDAAWLALHAAAWSALQEGGVSGVGMARGLRHIGRGAATPLGPSSWKGTLAAFRAGMDVDVRGASGDLDFAPHTRAPSGSIEIWGVADQDGRFSTTTLDIKHSE
jgi:branched-chain amino acid transport system substrate-binding protein